MFPTRSHHRPLAQMAFGLRRGYDGRAAFSLGWKKEWVPLAAFSEELHSHRSATGPGSLETSAMVIHRL